MTLTFCVTHIKTTTTTIVVPPTIPKSRMVAWARHQIENLKPEHRIKKPYIQKWTYKPMKNEHPN